MRFTLLAMSILAAVLSAGTVAQAATYYVDFAAGADDRAGTSAEAAFKHSPGDPEAAGQAKEVKLAPGDTVLFKGGVIYRGGLLVTTSGQEGKPIVFDGNTGGAFGQGRAIIDGSVPITGWKRCASAAECGGNPNWKNIYYAAVPKEVGPFTSNLTQGDVSLNVAQDPKPSNPFFEDIVSDWRLQVDPPPAVSPDNPKASVYGDASYFTQPDPHFYDGGYFVIYIHPNAIAYQKVLAYDPVRHQVTFDLLKGEPYKTGGEPPGRISMMNCLGLLGRAGEFVVDEKLQGDQRRLYLWPLEGTVKDEKVGPEGVGHSVIPSAFQIKAGYVTVQGFRIQKQGGAVNAFGINGGGKGTSNITIRDNDIALVRTARNQVIGISESPKCVVTGNTIHENRRAGGICLHTCDDSLITNNKLHKNGATGILLYASKHVRIAGNTVTDHKGMHANGLTAYTWCVDVSFIGNRVSGGNAALTLEKGDGILVAYNILDGDDKGTALAIWDVPTLKNLHVFNNLIVRSYAKLDWTAGVYFGHDKKDAMVGYVFRNNVIDGMADSIPVVAERSNNIYTRRAENESRAGWKPGLGEVVVTDLAKIFVDPEHGDWRLKAGSPAIDAGVDVGLKEDFGGAKVPQGKAPDVGAYEYKK